MVKPAAHHQGKKQFHARFVKFWPPSQADVCGEAKLTDSAKQRTVKLEQEFFLTHQTC
jgi:hypothetical protein